VHLVVGVDVDDNLFVLDVWRGQTNSDVWVESWLALVRQWKPLLWAEERGQIVKSIGPFIDKRLREARVYCRREQVTSAADKPMRSRSIQARAAMGKVYLPSKAPWLSDFLSELLMFPAGKHGDVVDSAPADTGARWLREGGGGFDVVAGALVVTADGPASSSNCRKAS
jgi:predicted phage terminase large subunit-like protein